MAKYDDMSFGKAFAAARKEKGAGKTFTWRGSRYTTDRADDKKPSGGSSTDSVVERAGMAKYDDMSFGKAFAAARKEKGAGKTFTWRGSSYTTDTKEGTPKVTTTQSPPGEGAARTAAQIGPAGSPRGPARGNSDQLPRDRTAAEIGPAGSPRGPARGNSDQLPRDRTAAEIGPAGSPRGPARAMRTLSDITLADWAKMSPAERKSFGLPNSRGAARAMLEGTRMAKGGMVKSGYAKGGMIKANCGASVKPTQKGTKK